MHHEARGYDILLVDDSLDTLTMLGQRLQRAGYRVTLAGSAEEAQKLIATKPPHLVLLDICMPGVNGLDLLRSLRAAPATRLLPVIMVTAVSDTDDVVDAIRSGASDYVTKPVNLPVLVARMETQLRMSALLIQLESQARILTELAAYDELTGLYNRRSLLGVLDAQLARAGQQGRSLALLLLDIDHFKVVNDTHGHAAGDAVLQGFARRISSAARASDVVGRHGGDEFCVVLPETECEASSEVAERLRAGVAGEPFEVSGVSLAVTVSIGVAVWRPERQYTRAHLLESADRAMYDAKRGGRNLVVVSELE